MCSGCRQREARIAELLRRVADLEATVRDLQARLGPNASNSSLPPSANPRDAPRPVAKQKPGQRPGAQPGHPAQLRQLLPAERVSRTEVLVPTHCAGCRAERPAVAGPHDPLPVRFQSIDRPDGAAVVVEYQGHARPCVGGGAVTHAVIPAAVRARAIGPGLSGTLA